MSYSTAVSSISIELTIALIRGLECSEKVEKNFEAALRFWRDISSWKSIMCLSHSDAIRMASDLRDEMGRHCRHHVLVSRRQLQNQRKEISVERELYTTL